MQNKTIHEIHKIYVNSGVSLVSESQGFENKELLQELLTELSQEYVKTVFDTVEKVKISAEEARQRDLISSEELKQKFFADIAKETNIDVKVKNAKQLVDVLFSENLEVPKARDEDILKPRILGTVENIGTIILPPDMLEIAIGSGRGREQKETPAGFDKIGMVEQRLSSKLSRERTTFHWKTGILNDNQMRKVSYYHLYVPEYNKTLLLNNQYGEGAFVVNGNFNIREAKKSDLKGSSEAVMIKFDYEHPEEFLERLDIELSKKITSNENVQELKHTKESGNNLTIICENIIEVLKERRETWYNLGFEGRQTYKLNTVGQEIGYVQICRYFGLAESQTNLYKDDMFDQLSKSIYGEGYYEYRKKNIKKSLESSVAKEDWYNLGFGGRKRYKLNIAGQEIGYVQICRYFGLDGSPGDLCKNKIFDQLSKAIYGEGYYEYRKKNIKEVLEIPATKEIWYNLGYKAREQYKLNINGQEIGYVQICHYFGFEEFQKDLCKDNMFDLVTKSIYGEGYYEYLKRIKGVDLTLSEDEVKSNIIESFKDPTQKQIWYNLGGKGRHKYKLSIAGQEIGYVQICRYFGFDGFQNNLYKDEIFDQISKKAHGEGYYAYWEKNIKEKLEDPVEKEIWYNLSNAGRRAYKLNINGQEIGYVQVCRYFGFEETRNDLYRSEMFKKVTQRIFGD